MIWYSGPPFSIYSYHTKTKDWFKTRFINSFYFMTMFFLLLKFGVLHDHVWNFELVFMNLYTISELCFPPILILHSSTRLWFSLAQNVHGNNSKAWFYKTTLSDIWYRIGFKEPIINHIRFWIKNTYWLSVYDIDY